MKQEAEEKLRLQQEAEEQRLDQLAKEREEKVSETDSNVQCFFEITPENFRFLAHH